MTQPQPAKSSMTAERTYQPATIHILWASSDMYPQAQFVTAINDGLWDAWREEADRLIREAKEWFEGFGDGGPWIYWVTADRVQPHAPSVYEMQDADD